MSFFLIRPQLKYFAIAVTRHKCLSWAGMLWNFFIQLQKVLWKDYVVTHCTYILEAPRLDTQVCIKNIEKKTYTAKENPIMLPHKNEKENKNNFRK